MSHKPRKLSIERSSFLEQGYILQQSSQIVEEVYPVTFQKKV